MTAIVADQMRPFLASGPLPISAFYVVFIAFLVSEYWISRHKPVEGAQNLDRGSGGAVLLGSFLSYGAMFGVSFSLPGTLVTRARLPLFVLGLVVAVAGQSLRVWSVRRLGASFTYRVHTAAAQKVIDNGPYRFIRHPAYTGGLLFALGTSIALTDWLAPLLIVFLVLGYAWRIQVEETALAEGLGEPYQRYMGRTKRVIPFVL